MTFLLFGSTIALGLFSWYISLLVGNYAKARTLGLPILISPVDPFSALIMLLGKSLGPYLRLLPFTLGESVDIGKYEWIFANEGKALERLGDAVVIVHPGGANVILSEGTAIEEVLARRKEFIKPEFMYGSLELFGKNLDSVNGEDWQRHRKITTPPFNERNSKMVWKETLSQASGMIQLWTTAKVPVNTTHNDTLTLALHVLTGAGFGKFYNFKDGTSTPAAGHEMSYKDALHVVLENFIPMLLVTNMGPWILDLMPESLNVVRKAKEEFKRYLVEMVEEERQGIKERKMENDTLVSALLRAADLKGVEGKEKSSLSDNEIYGNLFIYSFAGHDTTGNTLAYAIALLSVDNHIQTWLKEEVQSVFGGRTDITEWDYVESFPKLKRCLVVMYETLRLFPPAVIIPRGLEGGPKILKIGGKETLLPPNTIIMNNIFAAHTCPKTWGKNSFTWDPSRWLTSVTTASGTLEEFVPPPGTFIPWASGPGVCPGKKFAQVEFVAVLAKLMYGHRVKAVLEKGESEEMAKDRILGTVKNSEVVLTLKMNEPEKVRVVWEKDF